jgi:hypothetical protein
MSLVVPDTTPIATPWDCAVALTQPRSAGSRAPARARAMPALPARPIDIARAQVDLRALRVASPTGRLPLHRGWRAYDSGPSLQTFNQRSLALDHRPMCGRTVRAAGAVRVPLPRSTIAVSAVHGPAAPSFGLVVPVTPGSSRSPSATRVPRAKSPPVAPLGSVFNGFARRVVAARVAAERSRILGRRAGAARAGRRQPHGPRYRLDWANSRKPDQRPDPYLRSYTPSS